VFGKGDQPIAQLKRFSYERAAPRTGRKATTTS